MAIRFRSRHLHATVVQYLATQLTALGWTQEPVNFGTAAVTVVDYQPEDRGPVIAQNTVAVTMGNYESDVDEELGAALGGTRSALYPVFVDVYMAEQALALAITDDIRDIFTDASMPLMDQITNTQALDTWIVIEEIIGPERPAAAVNAEQFKKHWRSMQISTRLYFQTA